ncbi:MAG: hypothetical protein NTY07_09995 [Bacteroidia bacterium]|nr:hypothetical protein [Bacteroidia bacterium]
MKKTSLIVLSLAILSGLAIAWIDSRPNWDDTGISVLMVLSAATLFGYFTKQRPWLTALAASVWIPIFGIIGTHNFGSLIAIIPGFIGAYLGFFFKKNSI